MRGTDGGSRVEILFSLEGHLWDTAWANMAIGMMTEAMDDRLLRMGPDIYADMRASTNTA